ncbi:MAG: hypothetical protein K0R17_2198 [Rariglobus sp.]|jgi:autotransporter-associated beta strand protein|nr:hypothetical protein [Rariglobus sp.]
MKSPLVRTSRLTRLIPAVFALAASAASAQTTYTWTSTTGGTWNTSGNWDANGIPVAAANSTIQFYTGTGTTITSSFNATLDLGSSFDLQTLILTGTAATTARTITINQTSSSLDFTGTANKITLNATGLLNYAISSPVNFANGLTVDGNGNTSGNKLTLSGSLSGSGGLLKSGTSTLEFTGTQTFSGGLTIGAGRVTLGGTGNYTGGTTLNSGRLVLASNAGLGASSGTLTLNGGIVTYAGFSSGSTRTVTNNVIIGGNVQFLDSFNIQGSNTLAFTGTVNLSGANRALLIDSTGRDLSTQTPVSISGVVSNGGIIKTGTGSLTLSNAANSYSGDTIVRQGTLLIGADAPSGTNGALGNATSAIELGDTGSASLGAALQRIQLLTNGAFTVDRAINVTSNNSSGTTVIGGTNSSGTTTYSNTVTLNRGVILAAKSGGITKFSGLIDDAAGSQAVTIGNYTFGSTNTGGGVIALTNAAGNTYDGGTAVTTGALIVNNTSGSGTGTGAVSVSSGATLGGAGSASGAITLAAGARLSPGDMDGAGVSTVGTFTGGSSLTWNSNDSAAGLFFNLGADQVSSDQLVLASGFTKGTGSTFIFDFTGSTLNTSITYTLVTFGSTDFVAGDFSAINGGSGEFALVGNTLVFGNISTIPEPSTYAAFAGAFLLAGAIWRRRAGLRSR